MAVAVSAGARAAGLPNSGAATPAAKAAGTITAFEFYNPTLDHYFVSPLTPDIEALDTGRFPGWYRTGQSFEVFPQTGAGVAGSTPVCRYYIPPEHGGSHFFSASPAECAEVGEHVATDPNYSGYILESPNVFRAVLPDATTGACPAATTPVHRLWNGRADSNHRYTTSGTIEALMRARGYVGEGYGEDAVAMCVPASPQAMFVAASATSPISADCVAGPVTGILYRDAEVEPRIAVDPNDPAHWIGVWQQDRWSDGGARALVTGVSFDAGRTWARSTAAFSRCSGGAAVGADYDRASDPWVTFSPDGTAHQIAIAFTGPTFGPTAANAVLVSRSRDGGSTWSAPTALVRDVRTAFNDKETITADPHDARYVYAVWDRLVQSGGGPTWFARTSDGGDTWEPARPIYDPGPRGQTLNNEIQVLPDGTLLCFFTRFDVDAENQTVSTLMVLRSPDRGVTWSGPMAIAPSLAIGARDPHTGAPVRDAANVGSVAVGPDGRIAVAWQDSRFSGGVRDAIAYSQSTDGGRTWSAPVRINAAPAVQAFVPTIHIRADGVVGVTYYDFRNDTADPATLPTDYWLTQSTDGVTWRETHVEGPFDLLRAPFARGYFLGDYQGLASASGTFVPFFARTNAVGANATDIFAALPPPGATAKERAIEGGFVTRAQSVAAPVPDTAWRARLAGAARETLARRLRGPGE